MHWASNRHYKSTIFIFTRCKAIDFEANKKKRAVGMHASGATCSTTLTARWHAERTNWQWFLLKIDFCQHIKGTLRGIRLLSWYQPKYGSWRYKQRSLVIFYGFMSNPGEQTSAGCAVGTSTPTKGQRNVGYRWLIISGEWTDRATENVRSCKGNRISCIDWCKLWGHTGWTVTTRLLTFSEKCTCNTWHHDAIVSLQNSGCF